MNPTETPRDITQALLHVILGDSDGGLVTEGDLPASEIARLIADEAGPLMSRLVANVQAEAYRRGHADGYCGGGAA